MPNGYIKNIVESRGFGFIEPRGRGEDLFFHANEIVEPLEWGERLMMRRVEYDVATNGDGRMRAVRVRAA